MLKYTIKRLLWLIPTLIGVLLLLFGLTYFLPGDPASVMLGPRATPEMVDQLNRRLHLDQPIHIRLGYYIWQVFHGNLGKSVWNKEPVLRLIKNAIPHTVILTFVSMGWAVLLSIVIGVTAAVFRNTLLDHLITGISLISASMANFVVACLALLLFSVQLNWFPVMGVGESPGGYLYHLILPSFALGLSWCGYLARLVRDNTVEVLNSDYIKTAKSFGAPLWYIGKYSLKNAVIPVISVVGLGTGKMLGGTVFVEMIFVRQGMGKLITDAVHARDLPIVQGGVLIIAFLYVLINLLADLSYAVVDPRIQYE